MEQESIDFERLTGPQKAAIFFMTMGEEFTAEFFRRMDDESIAKIGKCMSRISHVPAVVLNRVMKEFLDSFNSSTDLVVSGKSMLKKVLSSAKGEDRAQEVISRIFGENEDDLFAELAKMPTENLFSMIENEHPQTITLILSQLPQEKSGRILSMLKEELKADVALRLVQLSQVPQDVLMELKDAISQDVARLGGMKTRKFDGVEKLASILNDVDRATEEQVLSFIEQEDKDLAERIRQKMFVFEDLLMLDDKGFREILQNVDNQTLIKALKTASEEMKEKVFSNLSARASEMLRDDMEVMGPVRLRDVEEAQQEMIKVAKKLEEEGKLVLGGKGDIVV